MRASFLKWKKMFPLILKQDHDHIRKKKCGPISPQIINVGLFHSSCPSRSREAIRGKGSGPLRSRHLPFANHLFGLHHEDAALAAGCSLWHHQAAPGSHLTQLQFHGSAAAVWVRGPLHGPSSCRHTRTCHTLHPGVRLLFCQRLQHHLQHQKLWAICVHPPYLLPAVPGPPPVQTEPNNGTALKGTVTACSLTWKNKD